LGLALLVTVDVKPAEAHPHGDYGSVYRSVDGGRIWEDLNRSYPVTTVYDLSAPHPPRVWEATSEGLLCTDNLGQEWYPVGPRAIGDVVTVVDEDPQNGSLLVGGPEGLYWTPADLSVWRRVLGMSAGKPLSIRREGQKVTVETTSATYLSENGGKTFTRSGGRLEVYERELGKVGGLPRFRAKTVLSAASLDEFSVVGTTDGAFVSRDGGPYEVVAGTEGLDIWVVHSGPRAEQDGLLLGTSRGLLLYDPRQPGTVEPIRDIPPFLSVGELEASASRPDELFMATSIQPYPEPRTPSTAKEPATAKGAVMATAAAVAAAILAVIAVLIYLVARRAEKAK
jgi:photosystem II stability/assembly factor-like uncharacterized protein